MIAPYTSPFLGSGVFSYLCYKKNRERHAIRKISM